VRRFPGVAFLTCCNAAPAPNGTADDGLGSDGGATGAGAEGGGSARGAARRRGGRGGMGGEGGGGGGVGEGTGRGAVCFSKACVKRQVIADADAAATCAAGFAHVASAFTHATSASDPSATLEATAQAAIASSTMVLGKYRSEVEIAIQHALALGLADARYRRLDSPPPARPFERDASSASDPPQIHLRFERDASSAASTSASTSAFASTSSSAFSSAFSVLAAEALSGPPCDRVPTGAGGMGGGAGSSTGGGASSAGKRARRRGVRVAHDGASCMHVGISIPVERVRGFRVLLAKLKKRAFRTESALIEWH
jgi:hypothetical protein